MARKRILLGVAAGFGLATALSAQPVRQRLWARLLQLPPAQHRIALEADIAVPMADGARLLTDHYAPQTPGTFPTILIRTPYGKRREAGINGLMWGIFAARMAERGYHVVVQLTRGRFASGGSFDPLVHEAADGLATLEWMRQQPWFDGRLGTWGPSYLGYVQWALAAAAPPELRAMVPIVTGAQLGSLTHLDSAFGLDTLLAWATLTSTQGGEVQPNPSWLDIVRGMFQLPGQLARGFRHLPLGEADAQAIGRTVGFYQDWLHHTDLRAPYWQQRDHTANVAATSAPAHFLSGWYDLIQRELLADYLAQRAAGRTPFLTIGPWPHTDPQLLLTALQVGIAWFNQQLKGEAPEPRQPVQLFVMGEQAWRGYASWPPPATTTSFFLDALGALSRAQPDAAPPSRYRYDPSDPTPALGGARLVGDASGPRDQRPLEARADVLCYTSAALEHDLDVIGPVRLVLYVRSSLEHTDFLGRLCDVYPDGRSINICDGLVRLVPGSGERQPDGSLRVEIDMWNTAIRFQRGHRIRLHVASGAHPRWNRNLGTGEALTSGTTMRAAEQLIYHDSAHPSALLLPVV